MVFPSPQTHIFELLKHHGHWQPRVGVQSSVSLALGPYPFCMSHEQFKPHQVHRGLVHFVLSSAQPFLEQTRFEYIVTRMCKNWEVQVCRGSHTASAIDCTVHKYFSWLQSGTHFCTMLSYHISQYAFQVFSPS
jgi:hypothetical protein